MKLSFSLPPKPSSSKQQTNPKPSPAFTTADEDPSKPTNKEYLTEFDDSKTPSSAQHKPNKLVIPPIPNEYRPHKKMKNLELPLLRPDLRFFELEFRGARVSFDTTNGRDSFYRASVHFVFDRCGRVQNHSTSVQIDGEDAQQFVAGLADNIGLENTHAVRIVSAAVAARTWSCFLPAWPEMEMVARGLAKHLKVQQREFLMDTLVGVCGKESHRSSFAVILICESQKGYKSMEVFLLSCSAAAIWSSLWFS
ncbi:hypothetical protein RHGRI_025708 [Rhododendron griersonianum]|uniref:Uncharacterized protein n=1 Tax=Rhododendron griersonianum TaxID=479676 RepID=A0AAV6IW58_9ERIC|nr:hypothetical protein RHGRI_025708 [Rhododendron griersonianum]